MVATYPDHKFHWIRDTVNTHFDFLLQQGYRIISMVFTTHTMDDWQVMLLSNDCFVRVRCDHGRVSLGLSTVQLLHNQVGFFDLVTLIEFAVEREAPQKSFYMEGENEGQQIREIARLFDRYSNDVFQQFDVLSSFILDRLWLISEPNQNRRLSMDNRLF